MSGYSGRRTTLCWVLVLTLTWTGGRRLGRGQGQERTWCLLQEETSLRLLVWWDNCKYVLASPITDIMIMDFRYSQKMLTASNFNIIHPSAFLRIMKRSASIRLFLKLHDYRKLLSDHLIDRKDSTDNYKFTMASTLQSVTISNHSETCCKIMEIHSTLWYTKKAESRVISSIS